MDWVAVLILSGFVVFWLGAIAVAVVVFIPQGWKYYAKWQQTNKPTDLGLAIYDAFMAFFLLSGACIEAVRLTLKYENYFYRNFKWIHLALFLALTYLLIYFAIPKTVMYFRKWQSTRRVHWFSISMLCGLVAAYAMSVQYFTFISVIFR